MSRIVLSIVMAVASAGCYSATIHLAEVPVVAVTPSPTVHDTFHLNLVDLIEITDPIDLDAACAGSRPVSIEEGLTPLGAFANFLLANTVPIVSVMNSSVICAAP